MAYYLVQDKNPIISRPLGVVRAKNLRVAELLLEVIVKEHADWHLVGSVDKYIEQYITFTLSSRKMLNKMRVGAWFDPDLNNVAIKIIQDRAKKVLVHQ